MSWLGCSALLHAYSESSKSNKKMENAPFGREMEKFQVSDKTGAETAAALFKEINTIKEKPPVCTGTIGEVPLRTSPHLANATSYENPNPFEREEPKTRMPLKRFPSCK